jgi:hypothetical protein
MRFHIICALLAVLFIGTEARAQPVARCSSLKGFAYYHHTALVPKNSSGFQEDAISKGKTTLQLLPNGEYDVLIIDARGEPISMKHDGGKILLLRNGSDDATFLVAFPRMVIELYTFYREADGRTRFDLLSSKGGDGMPIHKSSIMSGTCEHLDLSLIK